jgi:hypothetical protein
MNDFKKEGLIERIDLGLSQNTNAIMLRQAQHEDSSGLHPELVEG